MTRFLVPLRSGLLSALLLISSLAVSLSPIMSSQVNAASAWDSSVIRADSLILQEGGGSTIDVTSTWVSRIATSPGSLTTGERDAFESAYLAGNYSVSLYKTTDGYGRLYVNYYSSTKNIIPCGGSPYAACASPASAVNGFRMEDTSTISYGQIMMYYNGSDTFVQTGTFGAMVAAVFSFGSIQPFEVGFPVVYPPGYNGTPVQPETRDKIYPKILYLVAEYDFTANYVGDTIIPFNQVNQVCTLDQQPMYVTYSILASGEIINSRTLKCDETYNFKLPGYDNYELYVVYTNATGEIIGETDNYILNASIMPFVADGSSYTGANDGSQGECSTIDNMQVCEQVSPYEDCSEFGIDLIGGFGCIIKNFQIWIKATAMQLFVPRTSYFNGFSQTFGTLVESKLGFAATAYSMLVDWINSLIFVEADCTPTLGGGTFFGATMNYNFCAFEQAAPTIWTPLITIARLSIAAGFVFIAYRRMLEIIRGLGS